MIAGCGSVPEPPAEACVGREGASFELGTGETRFVSLVDGQALKMVRGSQGGCHFPLAFSTDGFTASRTEIRYEMENLTDANLIISSRQIVRLEKMGSTDHCQNVNFIAFLVEPWNVEEDRVRLTVTMTDDLGRTDTQAVVIVAKWPDPVAGLDRSLWCGVR